MRFTVHRPPSGEVSLCWHRPSGGDVACRVHIGITRPRSAGDALEHRLALAVLGRDMPTGAASLRRERSRDPFDAARSFVVEPGNQPAPPLTADRAVEAPLLRNLNTRLVNGATRRAGHRPHVEVLHPNGVEPARQISRVFSTQSRRRSTSRALSLAIASLVRCRLLEPRLARASRCCSRRSRVRSPGVRLGVCSSSPVDSATDTATPRSMPTTLPSAGPGIESGMCANATCQRPARSRVMR